MGLPRFCGYVLFTFLVWSRSSFADEVKVQIVDVGAGNCAIAQLPDEKYVVFDAGHWFGKLCFQAMEKINKTGRIELIVISHNDSDHLGDAARIINQYEVGTIVTTGEKRTSKTWKNFNVALLQAEKKGTAILNAYKGDQIVGKQFTFENAKVTLIYGKGKWDGEPLNKAESHNAISIVAKLEFANRAVLFTGDTVGRHLHDPEDVCRAAEKDMVLNQVKLPLKSDILIAPHHGANNASSDCFIQAVSPKYVIFPAGHKYGHPALATKLRFEKFGILNENIFRTDLNDIESDSPFDWEDLTKPGCKDQSGDDDIEIKILSSGEINVNYSNPNLSLCS